MLMWIIVDVTRGSVCEQFLYCNSVGTCAANKRNIHVIRQVNNMSHRKQTHSSTVHTHIQRRSRCRYNEWSALCIALYPRLIRAYYPSDEMQRDAAVV